MDSPYDVLLLDEDADDGEIERAYRERVKQAHPDHGGSVAEFRAVRTAYEAITADAPADDTDPGPEPDVSDLDRDPGVAASVEYLDYEVLNDHGWDLDDPELFENAAAADLDSSAYGRLTVDPGESLLEAAERCGFAWPFACRGGACANCAVALLEGEMTQPVDHILPAEMTDRGIRLSCNGIPVTGEMQVVYNLKHLPDLEDFRLPPYPFDRSYPSD